MKKNISIKSYGGIWKSLSSSGGSCTPTILKVTEWPFNIQSDFCSWKCFYIYNYSSTQSEKIYKIMLMEMECRQRSLWSKVDIWVLICQNISCKFSYSACAVKNIFVAVESMPEQRLASTLHRSQLLNTFRTSLHRIFDKHLGLKS